MGTFVVLLIVILVVGLAVRSLYKNKKEGKASCGCDCGGCSACHGGACHGQESGADPHTH